MTARYSFRIEQDDPYPAGEGQSREVCLIFSLRGSHLLSRPVVADYDPTVNPLFRDVLAHYGVVALPCRVQDPDRKGKVESGIGHTQKTPLKGMRFESLEEAQAYLDRWEQRWADTRIHGTTKRQVATMHCIQRASKLSFSYYFDAILRDDRMCGWLKGLASVLHFFGRSLVVPVNGG